MPDDSFAERFKRLELVDLLGIINRPEDYQPSAVDAAHEELTARQLTDQQLSEAQMIYSERSRVVKAKEEKWDKTKQKITSVAEEFSLVQFGAQSQDKYIRSITIFAGVYFLFLLYQRFWFLKSYFRYDDMKLGWTIVDWLLPLVWLPAAGILFGLKRESGWLLMAAYFWKVAFSGVVFFFYAGLSANAGVGLVTVLIFGGACYAIARKDVRETFKATYLTLGIAVAIGSFFALVSLAAIFIN